MERNKYMNKEYRMATQITIDLEPQGTPYIRINVATGPPAGRMRYGVVLRDLTFQNEQPLRKTYRFQGGTLRLMLRNPQGMGIDNTPKVLIYNQEQTISIITDITDAQMARLLDLIEKDMDRQKAYTLASLSHGMGSRFPSNLVGLTGSYLSGNTTSAREQTLRARERVTRPPGGEGVGGKRRRKTRRQTRQRR